MAPDRRTGSAIQMHAGRWSAGPRPLPGNQKSRPCLTSPAPAAWSAGASRERACA